LVLPKASTAATRSAKSRCFWKTVGFGVFFLVDTLPPYKQLRQASPGALGRAANCAARKVAGLRAPHPRAAFGLMGCRCAAACPGKCGRGAAGFRPTLMGLLARIRHPHGAARTVFPGLVNVPHPAPHLGAPAMRLKTHWSAPLSSPGTWASSTAQASQRATRGA